MTTITQKYEEAKEKYASIDVDTEAVLEKMADVKISMHVWQGDDVRGFLSEDELSGGISVTGNYPGVARSPQRTTSRFRKSDFFNSRKTQIEFACYLFRHRGKGGFKRTGTKAF